MLQIIFGGGQGVAISAELRAGLEARVAGHDQATG